MHSGCKESPIFSWVDTKNSPEPTTDVMLCTDTETWWARGTWMMATSCVTQSLVPSYLQEFDDANADVGAERTLQKTEVIHFVDDLGTVFCEWRIDDVPKMAKVSTVTVGSTTLGVAVGRRQFIADWLLAKAEVIRAMHERVQLCQDLQTEFAFLRESLAFCRNGSWKHAWPQSLKKTPPPTSKPLMTKTEPRPSCMFKRRPRQQTKRGSKQLEGCRGPASQTRQCQASNTTAPLLKMMTAMIWTSQHPRRADSVQGQLSRLTRLIRLKNTLLSKGAWQQVSILDDM